MKTKYFSLLFLLCISLNGFTQNPGIKTIFALMYPDEIEPFTGDTIGFKPEFHTGGNYVKIIAYEKQAHIKTWPCKDFTLVGLTLEENDPVMTHQQQYFFRYRNGSLENISMHPALGLSAFFPAHYLDKNNMDANTALPHPVFRFSEKNNAVTVTLQTESFDTELMGEDDPMTKLDPEKMQVSRITLEPEKNGDFEVKARQYKVGNLLEFDAAGGWENACEEPCSFTAAGSDRFVFSNAFSSTGTEKFSVSGLTDYDEIKISGRCVFAYGKRISETEGVVFYDSTLVKNIHTPWYVAGNLSGIKENPGETFFLQHCESSKNISLKGTTAADADAAIVKATGDLFSLPADASPGMKENRKTRLYPYAVETEVTLMKGGKTIGKYTLVFMIRHGEC